MAESYKVTLPDGRSYKVTLPSTPQATTEAPMAPPAAPLAEVAGKFGLTGPGFTESLAGMAGFKPPSWSTAPVDWPLKALMAPAVGVGSAIKDVTELGGAGVARFLHLLGVPGLEKARTPTETWLSRGAGEVGAALAPFGAAKLRPARTTPFGIPIEKPPHPLELARVRAQQAAAAAPEAPAPAATPTVAERVSRPIRTPDEVRNLLADVEAFHAGRQIEPELRAAKDIAIGKRPLDFGTVGKKRMVEREAGRFPKREEAIVERSPLPVPKTPDQITPKSSILDPNVSTNATPQQTYWRRTMDRIKEKLPQDYFIWKLRPNSAAVTGIEDARTFTDDTMTKLLGMRGFARYSDPMEWMKAEQHAYEVGKAAGNSLEAAQNALPPLMREISKYMHSLRPLEKRAKELLSGKELADEPLYLFPHIAEESLENVVKLTRRFSGMSNDFRTSLGAFEKPRKYATMLEGMTAGETYADPRLALLYRMWAGTKLAMTGRFIENLEKGGVLFRTAEAAKAAFPKGTVTQVKGIPGEAVWYAATKEEARFVHDQLADPHVFGGLARVANWMNGLFRNLNLWNPLPHFTKNMLYKYGFSGGKYRQVFQDMNEIRLGKNPEMIALYEQYMPYSKSGRSAHDTLFDLQRTIRGASTPEQFWQLVNSPNRASARFIFSKLDPWLKYSRFKQYVQKGLDPQEAANQTHLDLIRYGVRSEAVDIWKAIPGNFFVPWRVGTVTSTIKNLQLGKGDTFTERAAAPLKAAIFVLAMDGIREAMYRQTGYWYHMPIDYVQTPIAKLVENAMKGVKGTAGEMGALLATTTMFGPGSESTLRMMHNLSGMVQDRTLDWRTIENMFWGFTIIGDPAVGLRNIPAFLKDGNPKHLLAIASNAALATHTSLNHIPSRLARYAPGEKHREVQQAEEINISKKQRRELREERRKIAPYPTTEERVRGRQPWFP